MGGDYDKIFPTEKKEVTNVTIFSDKQSVKIYVLYLTDNINYPLDYPTVNDMIMQNEFVGYIDFAECFAEMLDDGLILTTKLDGVDCYYVSDRGRTVAQELSGNLLPSVLDDSLANAWRMIDFNKRGIKCHAELNPAEDGRYTLHCEMTERKKPLFSIDLTVDSEERARRMKDTFGNRPDVIYRGVLALMTGEAKFLFD